MKKGVPFGYKCPKCGFQRDQAYSGCCKDARILLDKNSDRTYCEKCEKYRGVDCINCDYTVRKHS